MSFKFHRLNPEGIKKSENIAALFEALQSSLESICGGPSRELSIAKTKLEEACFFSKKAMAVQPDNQEK